MRTCEVVEDGERCPKPHIARGMCQMHYRRWSKWGDPLLGGLTEMPPCQVIEDGQFCGRPYRSRGMCEMHYSRWYVHGDPLVRLRLSPAELAATRGICSVQDCSAPHVAKGYCKIHYDRWRHHGKPDLVRVVGQPFIKGGYWMRWAPRHPLANSKGHVVVAREVLWKKLRRRKGEPRCQWCSRPVSWDLRIPDPGTLIAMHLDGNRLNNDSNNLAPGCPECHASERHVWRNRVAVRTPHHRRA